ncbi:ABC transporter permease [Fructobacillus fructosus]|uniref:ABC transporter permease n=1 Tax=Fructobacillus fructosus TaxID=1631 RepID=UPI002DA1EBC5|nr:Predicted ABC-type exoprotein transport system [Fructobacillus fructosus]CAK1226096.1 Predicted ABC-type exoprotein transport system [Fructobacillus fructosus]CAK1226297.1 Predicted ABC-type exoprotein transport system [Fructobacillus fructosus]
MRQSENRVQLDALYQDRLQRKQVETKRYLKLLFNDHFLLFLTFAFGALVLAFRQLSGQSLAIYGTGVTLWQVFATLWVIVALFFGHFQSQLEKADRLFLLAAEGFLLQDYLKRAKRRSLLTVVMIEVIFFALGLPLFVRAGLHGPWAVLFLLLLMVLVKVWQVQREFQTLFPASSAGVRQINWPVAVAQSEKMAARRYAFFSLFAEVPKQGMAIKRRAYLDRFLAHFSFSKAPARQLALRQLIRNESGLTLVLRQFGLTVFLLFILRKQPLYIAVILVIAFTYLAVRQLWPIFQRNRHQLWNKLLFPRGQYQMRAFSQAIFTLLCPLVILIGLLACCLFTLVDGLVLMFAGFITLLVLHFQIILKSDKLKGDK